MKKRIILAAILCLSVWLITASVAFGATVFTKSLNATVKVVSNTNFSYYSDSAATQLITSISLPDVVPGGNSTFTVYVKNTSSADEIISPGTTNLSPSTGTLSLSFDGLAQTTLPANAVSKVVGILSSPASAAAGTFNFAFAINAAPTTTGTTTTTTGTTTTTTSTTTTSTIANVSYSASIQPVLNQYCVSCHGSSGGVSLSSYSATRSTVSPGNAAGSRLYQSVTTGSMTGYGMSAAQKQSLADWINQGALNN